MTARGRTLRTVGATALMVVAAAGCGGGPKREDPAAELRRWRSAVDDVCRATRERIAARGDARDALDLHTVAIEADKDVRAAFERIRAAPLSAENRRRVQPFLAQLDQIEPRLADMTSTTTDGTLNEIGRLGLRLADTTKRFQERAEAAGLRECADKRQFDAVLDAFTAPVYATRVARIERWMIRALRSVKSYPPSMPVEFVRYLRRVSRVYDRAGKRLDHLYDYKPNRAVEAADDVHFALQDHEELLEDVARSLDGGRRVLTPVGVKRFRRATAKQQRKLKRCIVKLHEAIGADPLVRPGSEPPDDSGFARAGQTAGSRSTRVLADARPDDVAQLT
jgi:hypothetical protein